MRAPTAYEEYLIRTRKYYEIKHLELPAWLNKADRYYHKWFCLCRDLKENCDNRAIPRKTMEFLANPEDDDIRDLPKELLIDDAGINSILKSMYDELVSSKDRYFINDWTLSKSGVRKMREYIDKLNFVYKIEPPDSEFTNVPGRISFISGINSLSAEYELTVTLDGSRVCIQNRLIENNNSICLDFTERFLDMIIPMVQWERFTNLSELNDWNEAKDESVYQDYKIVLVNIDRKQYNLNLIASQHDNPLIEVLRLVWDEYKEILADNSLILPWFHILGLTE